MKKTIILLMILGAVVSCKPQKEKPTLDSFIHSLYSGTPSVIPLAGKYWVDTSLLVDTYKRVNAKVNDKLQDSLDSKVINLLKVKNVIYDKMNKEELQFVVGVSNSFEKHIVHPEEEKQLLYLSGSDLYLKIGEHKLISYSIEDTIITPFRKTYVIEPEVTVVSPNELYKMVYSDENIVYTLPLKYIHYDEKIDSLWY